VHGLSITSRCFSTEATAFLDDMNLANQTFFKVPSVSPRHSNRSALMCLLLLGGIALAARSIPTAYSYTFFVAWSVCVGPICRLSHSCSLLKPSDGFGCRDRHGPRTVLELEQSLFISGPSRATAGPRDTFSRGPSGEKMFDFFKWRILVYFVFLSDSGTRGNVPP